MQLAHKVSVEPGVSSTAPKQDTQTHKSVSQLGARQFPHLKPEARAFLALSMSSIASKRDFFS